MPNAIDVVCFGELLWDLYEVEAPKGEKAVQYRRELGGASVNVAVTLARLGLAASVVGAVGKDKLGAALVDVVAAHGVETAHVAKLGAPTGLTFVARTASGEPTFSPYRVGTADFALAETNISPASAKASFCLVSSTSMLPPLRPATEKFLAAADKAKATIVVDLNARAHLWDDGDAMREAVIALVGRAAAVKASERDLAAVAGKRGMSWLEEHAKGATWILTRGENGAAAVGAHGKATAPTKRVRSVDLTGAGDAFVAGVLAVLASAGARPGTKDWADPKTWTRAMEVGHLLGARAVAAAGATTGLGDLSDVKVRLGGKKK